LKSYVKKARFGDIDIENPEPCLTIREKEILKLIVEGQSNGEIAENLFISIRTVETHKTNILQKLGLSSTVELVKFAIRNKIIQL
jgi:DNA-binding CsgD family transcriptional regulator